MVVTSHGRNSTSNKHFDYSEQHATGTFYIHAFLNESREDMKEHLENVRALNILTLFVIVIFLLTRWLPLVWLAIFLLMINTFNTRLARIIAQWWISAMRTLGRINTTIVLSLIFYFVLTPIAFLFRLAHREKTDHFLRNSKESYFEIVDKHFTAPDFERPW